MAQGAASCLKFAASCLKFAASCLKFAASCLKFAASWPVMIRRHGENTGLPEDESDSLHIYCKCKTTVN